MKVFFIFLFFFFSNTLFSQNTFTANDSIIKLRKLANNKSLSINERFDYSRRAIQLSNATKEDTTILASNRTLSYLFLINGDYDSIKRINSINFELASKLKDSLKMAFATHNLGFYFENIKKFDSAYYYYYKSRKFYNSSNRKKLEADILKNMANIQETVRDFIGAEQNAIEGIKILRQLSNSQENILKLWSLNNIVAIVSGQVDRYDKAIEYHNKALVYARQIKDDKSFYRYSNANIGILYRRKGAYDKAKSIFNEMLKETNLKVLDASSYITALSNLSYVKLLNGETDFDKQESLLKESLEIAKVEEDDFEVLSSSEYLSELYLKQKILDSSLKYADYMYDKAIQLNANQSILNALLLKAKIEDNENSNKYLFEHIKLNDSLVLSERTISNKFARINFETDTIKQEKDEVTKEKEKETKRKEIFIFTSLALLASLFFLYVIKSQREKNRELQLQQQQQQANEEIYNLMLTQQDRQDEARAQEKKRISQELHDGILGRLFGARLSLDSLNLSTKEDAPKNRENYIKELKFIEDDIRKVSHDLNKDFIEKSGFIDIVKSLIEKQTTAYNIDFEFNTEESISWDEVDNKTKIHLYRIIQESMQNTYKHAGASKIIINFRENEDKIELSIVDDGKGFDTTKSKKGIGIKNMDSRVKEIKGTLAIKSNVDNGTTIKIHVPV